MRYEKASVDHRRRGKFGRIARPSFVERRDVVASKDVSQELKTKDNVNVFRADLAVRESLRDALNGVDTIVHFAGVLFKHNPEKFLKTTNTLYFKNLLDVAV